MGAIGLNPIRLDRIGLDPIRINAIRLGVPGAASGSDRPYIDPEVFASLKAVCICYGKSNDDPDRAIVKNLVDPDNPFIISNAAYKLNSGYGKYSIDFLDSTIWNSSNSTITSDKIDCKQAASHIMLLYYSVGSKEYPDIPSFQVIKTGADIDYSYIDETGTPKSIRIVDGINTLPASHNTLYTGAGRFCGFGNPGIGNSVTLTQIPSYQGAFVTDGVDGLITSTKTVQEMGITDEITVVSMIHQISLNPTFGIATTNYIENGSTREHVRSDVYRDGKTGIYGYSASLINNIKSDINNILGDKADYVTKSTNSLQSIFDSKFSVVGRTIDINEVSSVAWYWTVIANKVLTTDQINQVIAYYNLDRCVEPTVLYDVKRQGLSNDTPDSDWYLKDFSKNGFDMSLFNFAKKGNSGVGKYNFSFINPLSNRFEGTVTSNKCHFTKKLVSDTNNFCDLLVISPNEPIKFKVSGLSDGRKLFIANKSGSGSNYNFDNGEYEVSLSFSEGVGQNNAFGVTGDIGDIDVTVEFIPSHAGALCFDGVEDYGKVTGLPIYKDYTVVADYVRTFAKENAQDAPILSKSQVAGDGAFLFNYLNANSVISSYSFGTNNVLTNVSDSERKIYYQSKYVNGGKSINSGTGTDYDSMWLGTYRDDSQFFFTGAIYSLMTFPYSMSEFLIERQLKKHKLGTLYPDMVEFRPVIKKDNRIKNVKYYKLNETADYIDLNIGDYIPVGQRIAIVVDLEEPYEITSITSSSLTDVEIRKAGGQNYAYDILGYVTDKSPQKITMDIQVDTNLIQWNPIITSTAELTTAPTFAIRGTSTLLKAGDWIPKNSEIWVIVTMNNLIDELRKFSFNGTFIHIPSSSYNPDTGKYGFPFVIDNESPQNINLTIDEYIRYEDIVQPYPAIITLRQDGKNITWGDKLKVDDEVIFVTHTNLLPNLYTVSGGMYYNGKFIYGNTPITVAKSMTFTTVHNYLKSNEPKCILSPSRLRIPNSSYKILGYIPDISGHGNHGKINNSAYAEGSGVNADGSYQLDGVDDFITIPTTVGGKQVLMKVNWQKEDSMIYNQNPGQDNFAIFANDYNGSNVVKAYASRNNGNTYIDGILNSNILATALKDITHNITITNENVTDNTIIPVIGANAAHSAFFAQMSLYDFMLFDEISTDEEILTLNEYVGIEGNTDDLFTENN